MRTLSLIEPSAACAWLESTPRDGQPTFRTDVAIFPFVIGRNASCNLPIESARVSREHVHIESTEAGFTAVDLGSTNGTFVNGLKIKESPLADGDLLTVANFGLVFHLPKSSGGLRVTESLTSHEQVSERPRNESLELIEAVREMQEMLLHGAVRSRLHAIVEMASRDRVGYEVSSVLGDAPAGLPFASRLPEFFHCPALLRLEEMSRVIAVERLWNCQGDVLMFLSPSKSELDNFELLDSLERLKQGRFGAARLTVQFSHDALPANERTANFCEQLREIGVSLALDLFTGDPAELEAYVHCSPAYMKVAPRMIAGLVGSPPELLRLQELVQVAQSQGTTLIGCGVKSAAEWEACKEAGLLLVQGPFVADAMPLDGCVARTASGL